MSRKMVLKRLKMVSKKVDEDCLEEGSRLSRRKLKMASKNVEDGLEKY